MTNNLKIALVSFVIIATALITFGVYNRYQKRILEEEISPPSTPVSNFPASEASPPAVQPESGSNTATVDNLGIIVTEPAKNSIISSPVKVGGFANVFGGLVVIRVKDANGSVLGQGAATACIDPNACPFYANLTFS